MKLVAYANEASLFPWKKEKKRQKTLLYPTKTAYTYIKFQYYTAAGISNLNDLKYNSQLDTPFNALFHPTNNGKGKTSLAQTNG